MRLLVFGGWGQLGTDLALGAEGRHELLRPTHAEVDVADAEGVGEAVSRARPDVVIDLAAFHKVEACEADPRTAFDVNAFGALSVGRAARAVGARCVYVSTDYVFDGERGQGYAEDDATGPLNVYGVSKEAGEHLVRAAAPDSLVVRGSGLFGHAGSSGKGGNFVETMLSNAERGEPISVVHDLRFSPTSTRDMAERMLLLLDRDVEGGTYHAANAGACTWFGFAEAIFRIAGVEADLTPRSSAGDRPARPATSVLLDTRSDALGLPPAAPWEEALRRYLAERAPPVPPASR